MNNYILPYPPQVAERAQVLSEEGPCLFFIDEIDSLCPLRTMESSLSDLRLAGQVCRTLSEESIVN